MPKPLIPRPVFPLKNSFVPSAEQLFLGFPEERYDIIWPRGGHESLRMGDFGVLAMNLSRREVKTVRELAGDIVVYHGTSQVVEDDWWLFQWERDMVRSFYADPNSRDGLPYAVRLMRER